MTNIEEKIWYAVIQNKADGPHSQQDIQKMLDGGTLQFTDFVFKPGMDTWTPIGSVKEFERRDSQTATNLINPIPSEELSGWVVLVKRSDEEGKQTLTQQGPLTEEQVKEKLVSKELQYDDHIWQKGFNEWKKIGALEIFDRRRPQNFEKQPKPNISQEKTMSGVEEVKNETADSSAEAKAHTTHKKSKLMISLGAAVMGMLVVYFGLDAYKQTTIGANKAERKSNATGQVVKINPQLKVSSIKSNTNSKPQLVFETNLKEGSKIQVEINAELGDILQYPTMHIKKEVTVVNGQLPILDLAAEDLPAGSYKVKASSTGLYTQTQIKVGVHDEALVKKLSENKSQLLAQAAKEKALLASSYKMFSDTQSKLSRLQAQFKKQKNSKNMQQSMALIKKNIQTHVAQNNWYEKSNTRVLVYPQAQAKYMTAKSKLMELTQDISKKSSGRTIASQSSQFEDYKKSLAELQTAIKNIK